MFVCWCIEEWVERVIAKAIKRDIKEYFLSIILFLYVNFERAVTTSTKSLFSISLSGVEFFVFLPNENSSPRVYIAIQHPKYVVRFKSRQIFSEKQMLNRKKKYSREILIKKSRVKLFLVENILKTNVVINVMNIKLTSPGKA